MAPEKEMFDCDSLCKYIFIFVIINCSQDCEFVTNLVHYRTVHALLVCNSLLMFKKRNKNLPICVSKLNTPVTRIPANPPGKDRIGQ